MKAVADASALLSLEYMGVLDDLLNIADIYTTESVNEELKEITCFRDEKSGIAKRILLHVSDGKVKCIHIPKNNLCVLCASVAIFLLSHGDSETQRRARNNSQELLAFIFTLIIRIIPTAKSMIPIQARSIAGIILSVRGIEPPPVPWNMTYTSPAKRPNDGLTIGNVPLPPFPWRYSAVPLPILLVP
jgi:hypothetical protein